MSLRCRDVTPSTPGWYRVELRDAATGEVFTCTRPIRCEWDGQQWLHLDALETQSVAGRKAEVFLLAPGTVFFVDSP